MKPISLQEIQTRDSNWALLVVAEARCGDAVTMHRYSSTCLDVASLLCHLHSTSLPVSPTDPPPLPPPQKYMFTFSLQMARTTSHWLTVTYQETAKRRKRNDVTGSNLTLPSSCTHHNSDITPYDRLETVQWRHWRLDIHRLSCIDSDSSHFTLVCSSFVSRVKAAQFIALQLALIFSLAVHEWLIAVGSVLSVRIAGLSWVTQTVRYSLMF